MATWMLMAVKDEAVGAFMAPFAVRSRNEALRSFTDAVNDPKMQFNAHPEDYTLYVVGEWDDYAGLCRELTVNEKVVSAKDVKRPE